MTRPRPRVLLVEHGPEHGPEHDGAAALGRILRDAGMEVIQAGPLATIAQVLRTVEQEDPDALGVVPGDPASLDALEGALDDVRVFVFGPGDDPGKVAETLAGGRSHTHRTPPDRAR